VVLAEGLTTLRYLQANGVSMSLDSEDEWTYLGGLSTSVSDPGCFPQTVPKDLDAITIDIEQYGYG